MVPLAASSLVLGTGLFLLLIYVINSYVLFLIGQ